MRDRTLQDLQREIKRLTETEVEHLRSSLLESAKVLQAHEAKSKNAQLEIV